MNPHSDPETNLIWIDLEMTGLDWEIHRILEISAIITNKDLEILEIAPHLIIHQPEKQLALIDPTIAQLFLDTGLTEESRKSSISEVNAEEQVLEFVKKYCNPQLGIICGNGIYLDRAFLFHQMPVLYKYLHHRIIDVSSIKELYKRWRPNEKLYIKHIDKHRADSDIINSIEELKYYRETGFIG